MVSKYSMFHTILRLIFHADEKEMSLLAGLSDRNMASRHQEHFKKRIDGTGDWVINQKIYKDWKCSRSSLLWLSGSGECITRQILFMSDC